MPNINQYGQVLPQINRGIMLGSFGYNKAIEAQAQSETTIKNTPNRIFLQLNEQSSL